jgi:S-formylglutathione hydrolase FrmB
LNGATNTLSSVKIKYLNPKQKREKMAKVISDSLHSRLIQRALPFRVILPAGYELSGKRFPVLYLLHGLFGNCDNWLELTDILSYVESHDLIVVAPDCGDSWYTDSETVGNEKFESYLIGELIPRVESQFRVITKRKGRAIAGISMGGYGAFKFALKRPNSFIFAASCSGAFDAPRMAEKTCGGDWPEFEKSISRVFGKEGSRTRIENDLERIVSGIPDEQVKDLPYFYLDCGNKDEFVKANRDMAQVLKNRNFHFDYREHSGGHDWNYWNKRLEYILEVAEKAFENSVEVFA